MDRLTEVQKRLDQMRGSPYGSQVSGRRGYFASLSSRRLLSGCFSAPGLRAAHVISPSSQGSRAKVTGVCLDKAENKAQQVAPSLPLCF